MTLRGDPIASRRPGGLYHRLYDWLDVTHERPEPGEPAPLRRRHYRVAGEWDDRVGEPTMLATPLTDKRVCGNCDHWASAHDTYGCNRVCRCEHFTLSRPDPGTFRWNPREEW